MVASRVIFDNDVCTPIHAAPAVVRSAARGSALDAVNDSSLCLCSKKTHEFHTAPLWKASQPLMPSRDRACSHSDD